LSKIWSFSLDWASSHSICT